MSSCFSCSVACKCIFAVLSPLAWDLHQMKHLPNTYCEWMTPDYNNHYWAPSLTIWSEEKKTEILSLPVHQVYLDYLLYRKGKATGKWWRWESFAGSSTHKAPQSFSGPLWCCCSQAWPQHLGRLWQPPVRQDTSSLNLIKKLTPPFVSELCLISLWE